MCCMGTNDSSFTDMNVARVTGLVARKKHKVSVIAVYADGVEKEDSVCLDHDG